MALALKEYKCVARTLQFVAMRRAKRKITLDRLHQAAQAAEERTLEKVRQKTLVRCEAQLDCVCRGTANGERKITRRTNLVFEWHARWKGIVIQAEVKLRCDKALYSGELAPPRAWHHALVALTLPRAIDAVKGLPWMRDCANDKVKCTDVALAESKQEPPESLLLLQNGKRTQHLRLARVTDDEFFCYGGSSKLNRNVPFHPANIVKSNSGRVWSKGSTSRKRLRGRIQWRGLKDLAVQRPQAYASAVSVAKWMASKDMKDMTNLERNPLRWKFEPSECLLLLWHVRTSGQKEWRPEMRGVTLNSLVNDLQTQCNQASIDATASTTKKRNIELSTTPLRSAKSPKAADIVIVGKGPQTQRTAQRLPSHAPVIVTIYHVTDEAADVFRACSEKKNLKLYQIQIQHEACPSISVGLYDSFNTFLHKANKLNDEIPASILELMQNYIKLVMTVHIIIIPKTTHIILTHIITQTKQNTIHTSKNNTKLYSIYTMYSGYR